MSLIKISSCSQKIDDGYFENRRNFNFALSSVPKGGKKMHSPFRHPEESEAENRSLLDLYMTCSQIVFLFFIPEKTDHHF